MKQLYFGSLVAEFMLGNKKGMKGLDFSQTDAFDDESDDTMNNSDGYDTEPAEDSMDESCVDDFNTTFPYGGVGSSSPPTSHYYTPQRPSSPEHKNDFFFSPNTSNNNLLFSPIQNPSLLFSPQPLPPMNNNTITNRHYHNGNTTTSLSGVPLLNHPQPTPNHAFSNNNNNNLFTPAKGTPQSRVGAQSSSHLPHPLGFAASLDDNDDDDEEESLFSFSSSSSSKQNKRTKKAKSSVPFQFNEEAPTRTPKVQNPSSSSRMHPTPTPMPMPIPHTPSSQMPMPISFNNIKPPTPSFPSAPTPSFPSTPSTPYLVEPPTPTFIDMPTPILQEWNNSNHHQGYSSSSKGRGVPSTPINHSGCDHFSLSQPTPKSTPGPMFSHNVTAVPTPDFSEIKKNDLTKRSLQRTESLHLLPETPRKRNNIRSRIKGNNNNPSNTPAIHTPEHFSKATPKLTVAQARLHLSENFDQLVQVGEGSFSRVFKAHHKTEDKWYAIKVLKRPIQSDSQRQNIIRELQYVKQLNHPHVLTYVFSWEQENIVHFQMELCELGSMSHFITEWQKKNPCKNFDEATLWKFFADIILGLHHIHCQNLVHRDIKPGNIFVDANKNLKIGDFGLAVPEGYEDAQEGDSRYLAPEVLDDIITKAADIFSLGATMFELACLIEMPKDDDLWNILRSGGVSKLKHFPQEYSTEMKEMIEAMMHPDYTRRPTTDLLIEHPRIIAEIERRRQAMHDNGEYITQVLSPPSSINPFHVPTKLRKFDTEDQILGDFTSVSSNTKANLNRKPKRNLMACFNNIAESGL